MRIFLLLCPVLLQLTAPTNAQSLIALFKLQRDACLPETSATNKFSGEPNRIACIVRCASARSGLEAVQMVSVGSQMDCECIQSRTVGTPAGRTNCERWDFQLVTGVSSNFSAPPSGSRSSSISWSLTWCPATADAWNPVVDVNKCIFVKDDKLLSLAEFANETACPTKSQVFNLNNAYTEIQLSRYLTYLKDIRGTSTMYWVKDSRFGTALPCGMSALSNASLNNCTTSPTYLSFYPICEMIAFDGANLTDIMIMSSGRSITWYYLNSTQVPSSEACIGTQLVSIKSDEMFNQLKSFILNKGWGNEKVWIASATPGSHLALNGVGLNNCLTLMVGTGGNKLLTESVIPVPCNESHYHFCAVGDTGQGSPNGSPNGTTMSQSLWLQAPFCPLSQPPPASALAMRTVGNRCFFYTNASYTMDPLPTDPNSLCLGSGPSSFLPALIFDDFSKARNYVQNIGLAGTSWEAWFWKDAWSGASIEGKAITMVTGGVGSYYLNASGDPFRGNGTIPRPVICRSAAEVCNSSQNYMNFVSSTNTCVAVEMTPKTYNESVNSCATKPGALLKLENVAKFEQIRQLLLMYGNHNQQFWYDGSAADGSCNLMQVNSPADNLTVSVRVGQCSDNLKYLCERPFG